MGYYTRYSITTMGKPFSTEEMDNLSKLEDQAKAMPDGELKDLTLQSIESKKKRTIRKPEALISSEAGYDPFEEDCKFYEHDEVLIKVSKRYPETIFILYGEGEEAGDLWKKYYLNGKKQVAKAEIVYEEFDESKLK